MASRCVQRNPVLNRGVRLCWNGKYGGSGSTSVCDIEHGARPTRTLRAAPGGDTTGCAACQGSSLLTWGRTRRGPRSINADDSGSEEERAAGGPGPGAVDPAERGVLTDRKTADCGGV